MTVAQQLPFDNTYARLPEGFFARVNPTPVPKPQLVCLNRPLAARLGLEAETLSGDAGAAILSGNRLPAGAEPLAMAYAGHQFGNWVPQLGDGRALLLGEIVDRDGIRRDIQLKGAGLTPFSRAADGRAVLGPVMREYLACEAMAGLGIPTTRALAMVTTGQTLYRERPEPGAVLTRVAATHVRVGTFEYFSHRSDHQAVETLANYVMQRNYPELGQASHPHCALLQAVVERTADLIAQWLLVGFIHGVMNTDNMSIAGETIDYGPFAFMDTYNPATVFSSIDVGGRYAFNQQPRIAHWNLAQFASALVPLLNDDEDKAVTMAQDALNAFPDRFEATYHAGLCRKLGLQETGEVNVELAFDLLRRMAEQGADYTLTFRRLAAMRTDDARYDGPVRELFEEPAAFDAWAVQWRRRLAAENSQDKSRCSAMRATNPAYVLRLHLARQAEQAALLENDFQPMRDLLTVLSSPFEEHAELADYARPPRPEEVVTETFCGT